MTEEQKTIKCPKCGTENSTDDKFCQECGNTLTKSDILNQPNHNTVDNGNMFFISFFIGFLIKFVLFTGVPVYLLYLGYNLLFNSKETVADYGIEYVLLKNAIASNFFIFGIAAFMIIILWIIVIYAEIILSRQTEITGKIEKLSRK